MHTHGHTCDANAGEDVYAPGEGGGEEKARTTAIWWCLGLLRQRLSHVEECSALAPTVSRARWRIR